MQALVWCGTVGPGSRRCGKEKTAAWVAFGAYDGRALLDGDTGQELADVQTGDIIKGSVTIDPDGFPLLYTGSRDNYLPRDRDGGAEPPSCGRSRPTTSAPRCGTTTGTVPGWSSTTTCSRAARTALPHLEAQPRVRTRGHGHGEPELVFSRRPGGTTSGSEAPGDDEVSIENSVVPTRATPSTSGTGRPDPGVGHRGLAATGWIPPGCSGYWVGEDMDASVVVDARRLPLRGHRVGEEQGAAEGSRADPQLDPSKAENPLVWSSRSGTSRRASGARRPARGHRDRADKGAT